MHETKQNRKSDLKKSQPLLFEISLIAVLVIFIILFNLKLESELVEEVTIDRDEEVVELAPVIQTDQSEQAENPPAPAKPQIPVVVPDDQVVEDQIVMLDIELNLGTHIDRPSSASDGVPSSPGAGQEGLAETLPPDLDKGAASIRECIRYPSQARDLEIEGRVVVTFVINNQGRVETPQVISGIGYGANEETLRCVRLGDFSRDGNLVRRTSLKYAHDFILRGRP